MKELTVSEKTYVKTHVVLNEKSSIWFTQMDDLRYINFSSIRGEYLRCKFPQGMHCVYMHSDRGILLYYLTKEGRKRGKTLVMNNLHDLGMFKEVLLEYIDSVYSFTTGLINLPLKKRYVEHYLPTADNIDRNIKCFQSKKHYIVKHIVTGHETYVPAATDVESQAYANEVAKQMLLDVLKYQVTREDVLNSMHHHYYGCVEEKEYPL